MCVSCRVFVYVCVCWGCEGVSLCVRVCECVRLCEFVHLCVCLYGCECTCV